MDYLNYFNPYQSSSNRHENNLTRAFLTLLKLLPGVQASFIELVRHKQIEKGIKDKKILKSLIPGFIERNAKITSVQTQKRGLESNRGTILSILISDERFEKEVNIKASDRTAVYDGVATYEEGDNEWIFIIENKPNVSNVWSDQLRPSIQADIEKEGEESFEIIDYYISIEWKEIIESLYSLIESHMVSYGEKALISQFFDYINEYYPQLNPYDSFAKCENRAVLLQKRCDQLMEQFTYEELGHHRGWKSYFKLDEGSVSRATVYPKVSDGEDWKITLAMYPGDTVSQARSFYLKLSEGNNREKLIERINNSNWLARPNLHFSYISSHLYWATGRLKFDKYIEFWLENSEKIKQHKKKNGTLKQIYEPLLENKLINHFDIVRLKEFYDDTNRPNMNLCPGVGFEYTWNKEEVLKIESNSERGFEKEVLNQLNALLSCWSDLRIDLS